MRLKNNNKQGTCSTKFIKQSISSLFNRNLPPLSWLKENCAYVEQTLLSRAHDFIAEHLGDTPKYDLRLDDRWHYIERQKKLGYKGRAGQSLRGYPYLKLTFHSFKQGGYSASFDDKAVIQELYQAAQIGEPVAPRQSSSAIQEKKTALLQQQRQRDAVESEQKQQAIVRDLALWERLSSSGKSPYLIRKQLPHVAGIRYGADFVAVLIVNSEGVGQGLQKIFDDGRKKFTYGLQKKGNFVLLGKTLEDMAKNTADIQVCEGIATGMSIHLAVEKPVFCALDANNIAPVVKNLRGRFKEAVISLWADNDQWKAEKKGQGARVLGNTGLIAAHRVAMQQVRVVVREPDFSGLDCAGLPTDFNDLHQLAGLTAVRETLPQSPNPAYAFFHDKTKVHQRLMALGNNTHARHIDVRYLPSDLTFSPGLHLIRSPIGTGKTHLMASLTKSFPNVLYISHLVSLVEDAAQRLNLTSYNACGPASLRETQRLAICVNSLVKLSHHGESPIFEVVIIDEVEQLLRRLTTEIANKPLVLATLRYLIQQASVVIGLDAHVSQGTLAVLSDLCPEKPLHVLINHYQVGNARTLVHYPDKETLQTKALEALEENKPCFLTFNSKSEATKMAELTESYFPDKKGLFICADNTGEEQVQAFIANINEASMQYDYVITTPSVNTGVSIDNNHFQFVGGCFCNLVNTPEDCMQALGRVRNVQTVHVYTDKHPRHLPTDKETLSAKWLATHAYDMALMGINADGKRVINDDHYNAIYLQVTHAKNSCMNQFFYEFTLLAHLDGYTIQYYQQALAKADKKELKDCKTTLAEQAHQQRLLQAETISKARFSQLMHQNRRTRQETADVEKHRLQQFYQVSPMANPEEWLAVIVQDNKGKKRQEILNLERALADEDTLKTLYIKQTLEFPKFIPDIKHYATEAQLYRKLLTTLELYHPGQGLRSTSEKKYNKQTMQDSDFIPWVMKNRRALTGVMNIPSLDKLQHAPLRFIKTVLAKLGLKQKRTGKNVLGNYCIEPESLKSMSALIQHRQGQRPLSLPFTQNPSTIINTKKAAVRPPPNIAIRTLPTLEPSAVKTKAGRGERIDAEEINIEIEDSIDTATEANNEKEGLLMRKLALNQFPLNATVFSLLQKWLEEQKSEKGTLAAYKYNNARSVPWVIIYLHTLLDALLSTNLSPQLILRGYEMLLTKSIGKQTASPKVFCYLVILINTACLHREAVVADYQECLTAYSPLSVWNGAITANDSIKPYPPHENEQGRALLAFGIPISQLPHTTACLCFVRLLKALQLR